MEPNRVVEWNIYFVTDCLPSYSLSSVTHRGMFAHHNESY